ncbi:AAA family ATPase [Streptomyces sp. NPDC126499]|uniref:ATP-binding protein n=1 Tax=Streptomyces sp. NPDC126499 TaxID=3155314 RepID=UPI0033237D3A
MELRVRRAVEARRAVDPDPDDAFRGLYLTEEAVERLLDAPRAFPPPEPVARAAPDSRLWSLAEGFGLSVLDVDILLIALLPDLDDRFEAFYGYLNDDVTRRRPSIGLALGLCGMSHADRAARARLGEGAPLRAGGLLLVEDRERPFLGRALRVPDRVTAFLLGDDTPDPRLADVRVPWEAVPGVGDPEPLARFLSAGGGGGSRGGGGLGGGGLGGGRGGLGAGGIVYLQEDQGGAGTALAASALAAAGRAVLGVDLARLAEDPAPAEAVRCLLREARLTGAGLVCAPVDAVARERAGLLRAVTDLPVPVCLVGRVPWDAAWSAAPPLLLRAPRVGPEARAELWRRSAEVSTPLDIPSLLSPFLLTPEQIVGAARAAVQSAAVESGPVTPEHVRQGARAQNAAGLDRLARRIEPTVGWDDLVLPPDTEAQLRELTARARHRDHVLGTWSMRPGGGRGRGVAALFAGDSGTGKTMSAEVIAADLGLDLYTVDLATVIDKYVGETEKNLERIFTEAAGVNGVLLFDEADAVFGKRSDVKDAHDRYANVESAYLLQRMESFDGLAILATNLRANLDDAFTRRLDLVVDFPVPDPTHRLLLWDRTLGPHLPRATDLDLPFCAEAFELSGGNIRSIAVTAAYLAAEAGGPLTMAMLIHAVQREYQKLGRLTLASEFGRYAELLT